MTNVISQPFHDGLCPSFLPMFLAMLVFRVLQKTDKDEGQATPGSCSFNTALFQKAHAQSQLPYRP